LFWSTCRKSGLEKRLVYALRPSQVAVKPSQAGEAVVDGLADRVQQVLDPPLEGHRIVPDVA